MTTGLDVFDRTVQKDLRVRLNTEDRHHAYSVLRASLHASRDRIGPLHAVQLGAQLPKLLRGLIYAALSMKAGT